MIFIYNTSRSRSRLGSRTSRLGLGPLHLGSRLGLGLKGLVHITENNYQEQEEVYIRTRVGLICVTSAYVRRRSQKDLEKLRRHIGLQPETAEQKCQPSLGACLDLLEVLL